MTRGTALLPRVAALTLTALLVQTLVTAWPAVGPGDAEAHEALSITAAVPPVPAAPPALPTSAAFKAFARSMPLCNPGETTRPSPFANVSGCRAADAPTWKDPSRVLKPSFGSSTSFGRTLLVQTALASDLGTVDPPGNRHIGPTRASIGTGTGRDNNMNYPQYGTGGDNFGSIAGILTPASLPAPAAAGALLSSHINFFNGTEYPGGFLDEVGWGIHGSGTFNCSSIVPRAFTDNGAGAFQCFPAYTLDWSTWYFFATLAIGNGQWGNFILWNNAWVELDIRSGLTDLSTGLDPGTEAACCWGQYTSGIAGLTQLRTPGGTYQSVGAKDPSFPCTSQPTGHACAYTIHDAPLAIGMITEHHTFLAVRQ